MISIKMLIFNHITCQPGQRPYNQPIYQTFFPDISLCILLPACKIAAYYALFKYIYECGVKYELTIGTESKVVGTKSEKHKMDLGLTTKDF